MLRPYRGHAPVVPESSIYEKSCDDFHKDVTERLLSIPPGRSELFKVACLLSKTRWAFKVVGLVTKDRKGGWFGYESKDTKNETITNDERKSYDARQRWRIPRNIS